VPKATARSSRAVPESRLAAWAGPTASSRGALRRREPGLLSTARPFDGSKRGRWASSAAAPATARFSSAAMITVPGSPTAPTRKKPLASAPIAAPKLLAK